MSSNISRITVRVVGSGLVGKTLAREPDDHKVAASNPTFYPRVLDQDS